jgi:hypothetical protein
MKTLTVFFALILSLALFMPKANATTYKSVTIILLMANENNEQIVQTIYTTLIAAEKVAKLLEVDLITQDKVSDDIFVFSLKTKKQKELTMQFFDEAGYELVGHRVLKTQTESNYQALHVEMLNDDTYLFELTDKVKHSPKNNNVKIK